jgi:hypothetical protein
MREFINEKGLWQSVDDNQIDLAKEKVNGELQLCCINDYYRGKRIKSITYEDNLSDDVKNQLLTNQAVLFSLE